MTRDSRGARTASRVHAPEAESPMSEMSEFHGGPIGDAEPADLLARQRAAFLAAGPPSLAQRRAALEALRRALLARRSAILAAICADFGHRAPQETATVDILSVVGTIRYLARALPRLMRPARRRVALHFRPGRARVLYQPRGVVGVIAPWNYPVVLALAPLAAALAAGNRVMLKPSEVTPRTSALLAAMLGETFPLEEVAVVEGDAATAAHFAALPFDHLVFTGSTANGRAVMRAASEHLVPVTLELGGKSPALVAPGAALSRAARSIAYGKLLNAGQTCMAPDYVLVPRTSIAAFVEAYAAAVETLYPGLPANPDYATIISEGHVARLGAMVEEARAAGAGVRTIGSGPRRHPRTVSPGIVTNLPEDARLLTEEIFGPILPVVAYDGLEAAIAYVNARPRPLALYLFGADRAERAQVLARTTSGNVTLDDTILHYAQDDLPFGGVGASGMGTYHGREGFLAMSHAKGVFIQPRLNLASVVRPPFGRLIERVLGLMLR